MVSEIFGVDPIQGGAAGLLALVILLILTGRLIPRRTHEDVIADRDNWRSAFLQSEAARRVEHDQTEELLEMAKLSGHILTALPHPGKAAEEEVTADARMDPTPGTRL
jgi:hypothetical protein